MNAIFLSLLVVLTSHVHALDMKALDALTPTQLEAIQNDRFSGSFRDKSRSLRLYTNDKHNYAGEILFKGELYLLKAMRDGERLQGYINRSGKRFNFELYFQGEALVFDSKQGRFSLESTVPSPHRPYPDSKPPIVKKTSQPQVTTSMSQPWDDQTSINYLVPQVTQDLQSFITLLRQWLTGKLEDKEATELVKLRLLPLAALLTQNLGKLESAAKAAQKPQLPIAKQHQWQHLEKISAHSRQFFAQWQTLLQQMLYLNQQGKQKKLKTLANKRLPIAIKNTQLVVQRLHGVLLELKQGIAPVAPPPVDPYYLQPNKLLKNENMLIMAEMMREAMRLFREMFFPDND